jgi:aspartyl-tRNA(Asn)/glutamyl-tRNA(Gln) amidotransferase subunit A
METIRPLTIEEAIRLIGSGGISAAAQWCRERVRLLDPQLRAFITLTDPSSASEGARRGLLDGIPIALKDIIDTAGIRTTVGSRFFRDRVPAEDAVVALKLKAAGAVIVGKTNTHEFALGATGINPHYGTPRNPWDPARVAGGSSSGSAVAVAAGMAVAALGTDTGGSIRVPAALCGVVGLKPTPGRVSTRGVFPLSWNLDHVGPITSCVRDAAIVLQVISGYDPLDPASVRMPEEDILAGIEGGVRGRTAALGVGAFVGTADPETLDAVRAAARLFQALGCIVREENLDWMEAAAAANRLITQADGAAVHRERLRESPELFGDDVRQRLEAGARTSSTEYVLARRLQAEVRRRCEALFDTSSLLLLPTTPAVAPLIEGYDPVGRAGQLTPFTAPFNLAGLPALSIPCGRTRAGLPIGLQIVSRAGAESAVLQAGRAYEREAGAGAPR